MIFLNLSHQKTTKPPKVRRPTFEVKMSFKNIDNVEKGRKKYIQLQKITKKQQVREKRECPISLKKENYVFLQGNKLY